MIINVYVVYSQNEVYGVFTEKREALHTADLVNDATRCVMVAETNMYMSFGSVNSSPVSNSINERGRAFNEALAKIFEMDLPKSFKTSLIQKLTVDAVPDYYHSIILALDDADSYCQAVNLVDAINDRYHIKENK